MSATAPTALPKRPVLAPVPLTTLPPNVLPFNMVPQRLLPIADGDPFAPLGMLAGSFVPVTTPIITSARDTRYFVSGGLIYKMTREVHLRTDVAAGLAIRHAAGFAFVATSVLVGMHLQR